MTTRREFLEGLGGVSLLGAYPAATAALLEASARAAPAPLRPPALASGMRVGLVAPASPLFEPDRYRMAEAVVRSLGLVPVLAPHARDLHGYLAGHDADRVADLNALIGDPAIQAIWCLRGGYGCLRLLPEVDYARLRAQPKVFVGYSDITALHLAIQKLTGVVTFHGPMLNENLSEYDVAELFRVAGVAKPGGPVGAPPPYDAKPGSIDREHRLVPIHEGRARGLLTGGNLSLLTRLFGTPFEPDLEGRILFIEDVGEAAYRVDGMLAQLRLSGKLGRCAGIVIGTLSADETGSTQPCRLPMETVVRDHLGDLGIPVLMGLRFGHRRDRTTLPYGVLAELDAGGGTLTLLEPAVA